MTAPVEATDAPGDATGAAVDAATRSGPPRWLFPASIGAAVGVGLAYVARHDPNTDAAYPLCPTFVLFGVDCPGCGGLRATHALTHGDVAAAADHNLVITMLWPLAVALWAMWLLRSLGVRTPRLPVASARWWWAIGAVLLGFTVARNLPFDGVFQYLAATA